VIENVVPPLIIICTILYTTLLHKHPNNKNFLVMEITETHLVGHQI